MESSRQEYWSGLSFPSLGDLPNPRIKPESPVLQVDSLPTEAPGKSHFKHDRIVAVPTASSFPGIQDLDVFSVPTLSLPRLGTQ